MCIRDWVENPQLFKEHDTYDRHYDPAEQIDDRVEGTEEEQGDYDNKTVRFKP